MILNSFFRINFLRDKFACPIAMANNHVVSNFIYDYNKMILLPTDVTISAEVICLFAIYHFAEISAIRVQNLLFMIIEL